jgi:hypothetical protein
MVTAFSLIPLCLCLAMTGCDFSGRQASTTYPSVAAAVRPGTEADNGSKPVTIAETEIDADRDGSKESLLIRMVSGRLSVETDPGPFTGAYWEGEFTLELHSKDGALVHELPLNGTFGGEPLKFAKDRKFEIVFEDYNNDGFPDFSIGQYLSSNGSVYNLYSLMPDGIRVLHSNLFTAERSYSHLYEKAGNTSFINRYYDMENGTYKEVLYTWQGERFVQTKCEGCGMTADER